MANWNKNGTWTSFLYIKNSFFNLKLNLELDTFDHGTFLYKVHELLLITLHTWPKHFYRNFVLSMSFILVKIFHELKNNFWKNVKGNTQVLVIVVHCLAKYLLNMSAIASNSVFSSLFSYWWEFIMDFEGSASFFQRRLK